MRAIGLFSGIGGLELGLEQAGLATDLLCEWWDPASSTLTRRFDAEVVGDIRGLAGLPDVDVVTAGFPCTDLSQVGRKAGIGGDESGLVGEVFRLVEHAKLRWLVLENVPNMLTLHGGAPIRHVTDWFDERGWNWAYRTVDSQHFGLAQRRRRVIVVASQTEDPRSVVFADDAGADVRLDPCDHGFYWTEGNRGVGWGDDVVPTLKGGSKLGIPSPPAVWRRDATEGRGIVRPSIETGERLQGFDPGWTDHVERPGIRWKLVGNAVSVPVARWVGERLVAPGNPRAELAADFQVGKRWPAAASSVAGQRETWAVSEAPVAREPARIGAVLDASGAEPLSAKATSGFLGRLLRSRLRAGGSDFHDALRAHVAAMA